MRILTSFLLSALLIGLVSALPKPEAEAEAEASPNADPIYYQNVPNPAGGSITYVDKRDTTPAGFRLLGKRDFDVVAALPILTRSPSHDLVKRTVSPDGSCGSVAGYTCTGYTFGGCCGGADEATGECGFDLWHCAGGCQESWGYCNHPYFMQAFDADGGDLIWDPVSDNVFEAQIGDGIIYYGTLQNTPSWPTK